MDSSNEVRANSLFVINRIDSHNGSLLSGGIFRNLFPCDRKPFLNGPLVIAEYQLMRLGRDDFMCVPANHLIAFQSCGLQERFVDRNETILFIRLDGKEKN